MVALITSQWVCTACGFNMIGFQTKRCRFCGATADQFIRAEVCSATHRVQAKPVNNRVTQLKSVPQLGYEHAAYCIETGKATVWIDCPSSFDASVKPMDYILFTHHDFLGAANLYRHQFGAQIWLHRLDAAHPNSRRFPVDHCFEAGFHLAGIEAVVMGGHTPGFTLYFFEDVLFICDYVDLVEHTLTWNAYGNRTKTPLVGRQIQQLLTDRTTAITTVCGVDYVYDYHSWKAMLDQLVTES